ncbi:hypothetical protein AAII07_41310 [Microvirga sp. 0TCS3.31]
MTPHFGSGDKNVVNVTAGLMANVVFQEFGYRYLGWKIRVDGLTPTW